MVRGGLWLHEAAESELPAELSVLSPAADAASLERAAAAVKAVAGARDAGAGATDGLSVVRVPAAAAAAYAALAA